LNDHQHKFANIINKQKKRYKEVSLYGDLIDTARPGEEVEIIGFLLFF
jgi:DNA replicative helicase MCM subunit Mcm2 (Cdc46/Mcm family)